MRKERWEIIDDLKEIQNKVDDMGFKGSGENDLWRREEIADYIIDLIKEEVEPLKLELWRAGVIFKE